MGRNSAIILLSAVAALVVLGLVMLSSTSVWSEEMRGAADPYALVKKQLLWLCLGSLGAWALALFDYSKLQDLWPYLLGGACVLLTCCYIPGLNVEVHGETRWVKFPGLPVLQPSELAKPIVVIALAAWFARYQAEARTFIRGYVIPCALLGIPCVLILFEKDLGTTMVLGVVGMAILFVAGTRILLLLSTAGISIWSLCWFVSQDEIRLRRILAFRNMHLEEVRLGDGWQTFRALEAFSNGGIFGTGLGYGAEKHGALPFAHTDFIFAALGEELGLVCTLITVFAFVLITIGGLAVSLYAREFFGKVLAAGITMIVVVPGILNMGVVTGSLPVTGLPLPFLSYGGSSLVFTMCSIGLLMSIHRRAVFVDSAAMPHTKERKFALKL
ncbi:FtsW/RodA/SpoVE family cell cycle protein [Roseibacillus persicicus]|uniref:Probable peptidoglycan glycosyltransferase FtsW n=1 Tax=Roseibacillus persicicus TaxID=454148 RepID=A0A918WQ01_9BACT|nr:putative peptidoglycan glycosyltransferase FtsW [Roseibacillus persicicus]MDQ8188706.1 putative peptidoglycan glycosyltransferase FtsW [Roseibacillus persicicus]GHC63286.1 stage V sporulation protein E [Roseibacillus persicicus]